MSISLCMDATGYARSRMPCIQQRSGHSGMNNEGTVSVMALKAEKRCIRVFMFICMLEPLYLQCVR
jgi:hypothetical protein